jgi:membrane-bound lytic murein transglycosylase B
VRVLLIILVIVLQTACAKATPTPLDSSSSHADGSDTNYGGWDYVAKKLIKDGIPEGLVRSVYEDSTVVPSFDFVPFKLRPKETSLMYRGFQTAAMQREVDECYQKYQENFDDAASFYQLPTRLLVAFVSLETHCGKNFGNQSVVNRLSRVASTVVEENVKRNLEEVKKEYPNATINDVRLRAKYLEHVFYPQLFALFEGHVRGDLDIFELKGSIAGAFGFAQFLPKTYMDYGVDADRDGHVNLFEPSDAIFSVGNFLKSHGWKNGLNRKEKREIIWHYNRSEPYIDTILFLSRL